MTAEAPGLTHAFRLSLRYDAPLVYGSTAGQRGFFRVAEGHATGRLTAEVADDGGDWVTLRPDGVTEFETRMMLRAGDGTLIYWRSFGSLRGDPGDAERFRKTGTLTGSYFRMTPRFDAPVGPWQWLASSVFLGTGRFDGATAEIDVFEVN